MKRGLAGMAGKANGDDARGLAGMAGKCEGRLAGRRPAFLAARGARLFRFTVQIPVERGIRPERVSRERDTRLVGLVCRGDFVGLLDERERLQIIASVGQLVVGDQFVVARRTDIGVIQRLPPRAVDQPRLVGFILLRVLQDDAVEPVAVRRAAEFEPGETVPFAHQCARPFGGANHGNLPASLDDRAVLQVDQRSSEAGETVQLRPGSDLDADVPCPDDLRAGAHRQTHDGDQSHAMASAPVAQALHEPKLG